MQEHHQQLKVRLAPDLKQWVVARALRNSRSINAEIAHTLRLLMERHAAGGLRAKSTAIREKMDR